jgi:hypothetical protein
MRMMTQPYIRIPVPVRACASTRTDPNTRTGMSITGNGNLRILVPTHRYVNYPGGTVGYPAQPGLICQSVSPSISPSVNLCVHACRLGI